MNLSRLLFQIVAGILGLWLAIKFVPGVEFRGPINTLLLAGLVLGLINFFIKPIINKITFPLRILTLGLFSLVINMIMVEIVDILFKELIIEGIVPLFWTSLIVWVLSLFFGVAK